MTVTVTEVVNQVTVNGTVNQVTVSTGAVTIAALTDTLITSPADKEILTYDGVIDKWVNGDVEKIVVEDESTDTTCFISFFIAATGTLEPKTNSGITFNSATGILAAALQLTGDLDANGQNITDIHELRIDASPDTDHTANGSTTNSINAGVTTAIGELLNLASDGEWALSDASAEATASGMMAVSLAVGSDGNPLLVALPGSFVRDDTFAFAIGDTLYAGATAGVITATRPSGAAEIVRVIGYAVTADIIYFNPSGTWVEIA